MQAQSQGLLFIEAPSCSHPLAQSETEQDRQSGQSIYSCVNHNGFKGQNFSQMTQCDDKSHLKSGGKLVVLVLLRATSYQQTNYNRDVFWQDTLSAALAGIQSSLIINLKCSDLQCVVPAASAGGAVKAADV